MLGEQKRILCSKTFNNNLFIIIKQLLIIICFDFSTLTILLLNFENILNSFFLVHYKYVFMHDYFRI